MKKANHGLWAIAGIFLVLTSCSTGSNLRKFNDENIEKEIPKEVAQKFEVKEVSNNKENEKKESVKPGKGGAQSLSAVAKKSSKTQTKTVEIVPNRKIEPMPFHVGEKLVYDVRFLGVTAATFTSEVLPEKIVNDRKVYQLRGRAKTLKLFELVYRADDIVDSFFDTEGLYSHRFTMNIDESKQSRKVIELYDYDKKKSYYWNRIDHVDKGFSEQKEEYDIKLWSQDPLSYLFFIRTVNLPVSSGDKVKIPVVLDGKQWESVISFDKKEIISVGSRSFDANVYRMENYLNGELKNKDNSIWVSNDSNRYILRVETKVRVGSFAVALDRIL
jgi:hypothetical protein